MIPQISYNVLIDRFRAFAEAHFLIKGFSHGDLSNIDIEKEVEFPWMHVLPVEVEPRAGSRLYSFVIIFADLPRDKETPAEYQRECISDCIKLAEDLLAEVQNGQVVFGPFVELDGGANIEVFINEFSHTLVGVNLQLTLSVPWDWSACDIPADFTIGGSGSGGEGVAVGITLQTNGVNNGLQSLLNLQQGTNVTLVDNGNGTVTISAVGDGTGTVTSIALTVPSAFTVSGSPITTAGTIAITGAGTSSDYIDGTGSLKTFPTIPAAQIQSDWNQNNSAALDFIKNKPTINAGTVTSVALTVPSAFAVSGSPITGAGTLAITGSGTSLQYIDGTGALQTFPTIPPAQVNADWDANSGLAEILNKPAIPKSIEDLIGPGINADDVIIWDGSDWVVNSIPTPKIYLDEIQDVNAPAPNNGEVLTWDASNDEWISQALPTSGTVTSVGLSMPSPANPAFTVSGSPVTTSGTLAVSANGTSSQYVDGTGALQSFPALTGFVPYTGATQDVDLGANKLSSASVYITGTNGNGHIHLKHQNADATATGQSTALWADNNGDIKWKNDGQYKTTLKTSSNTADRVYTFPNETAELMPRNAAITAATKTKITYDADGLITSGADLTASDIPSGIDAANIGAGLVNNTEFGYLDGVTSAIQTQLNGKQATIGLTTVGTNLATLPNPSAIRYLRINADNSVSALSLAQLKTDLGMSTVVLAANATTVGTAFENIGLSFSVTSGKVYRWRAVLAVQASAATTFTVNGPANTWMNYRFLATAGSNTAVVVFGGTTYDSGTNAAMGANQTTVGEGMLLASASGTVQLRFRSASAGGVTVRAGSLIEFEETL